MNTSNDDLSKGMSGLPPHSMSQRFYFCTDGKTVKGPLTIDELRCMHATGTLNDNTQICAEGTTAWQKITSLDGPESVISRRNKLLLVAAAVISVSVLVNFFSSGGGDSRDAALKNERDSLTAEGNSIVADMERENRDHDWKHAGDTRQRRAGWERRGLEWQKKAKEEGWQ
jgi:hypothetical protein